MVLPLVPTTPFVLLAAFCFAKSSPRLHHWLVTHRIFGPLIAAWQRDRSIPAGAKRAAYVAMIAVFTLSIALGLSPLALALQAIALAGSALFIATRRTAR